MSDGQDLCNHCGAPRAAGYAACKFCKTPYPHIQNTQTNAIPCPRCNTLNEVGQQKCVQCQTWIVVQCVFCHALSPHNTAACQKCGEAFAGAPQRLQERKEQQRLQTGLNIAGQVGNVAASVLGAAAVAGLVGGRSHHHHYSGGHSHHHYGGHHDHGGDWDHGQSGGGFLDSTFGRHDDGGTGAGIEQSNESGGGGFFDSLFGGSSDSGSGAGIEQSGDSGGSFWDSSGDSGSSDSGDSGSGFWDSDD